MLMNVSMSSVLQNISGSHGAVTSIAYTLLSLLEISEIEEK
jgi:hypothetical protein